MTSSCELTYAPASLFQRVLDTRAGLPRTRAFAALARLNTLSMIQCAGSGHIGSSFSSLELVTWIHLHGLRHAQDGSFRDIYFSSKGHDAPALYAVLIGLGMLPADLLFRLRRAGGLPGHPDVNTPHIRANTGSLGMGVSKAHGMLLAERHAGRDTRAFVLTGDGELQEGQFWESLLPCAHARLGELTVIVDHNRIQSDTWVSRVSDLGDLEARLAAHQWRVSRVDGHDLAAVDRVLGGDSDGRPHVVIADTVKGCGVSFMAGTAFDPEGLSYDYHSGAPAADEYARAVEELAAAAREALRELDLDGAALARRELEPRPPAAEPSQRLVSAYGRALVEEAGTDERIVALDADLVLDTGLTEFRERHPDRFHECGIAEMDMVSRAGGLALRGRLPVVHSFACFLSARPNEQIYANATEGRKVIYVGSLAGLLPGGPGHSHQCVRDIAALAGVPGLLQAEPASERRVAELLSIALHEWPGSAYLRLVSIPCEIPYPEPPERYRLHCGVPLRDGADVVLFAAGPVLLAQAWWAAERLDALGVGVRIVDLPWFDRVDREWLAEEIAPHRLVVALDNHYTRGGQGEMLAAAVAEGGYAVRVLRLGVESVPCCGRDEEVLAAHCLDAESIAQRILAAVGDARPKAR